MPVARVGCWVSGGRRCCAISTPETEKGLKTRMLWLLIACLEGLPYQTEHHTASSPVEGSSKKCCRIRKPDQLVQPFAWSGHLPLSIPNVVLRPLPEPVHQTRPQSGFFRKLTSPAMRCSQRRVQSPGLHPHPC